MSIGTMSGHFLSGLNSMTTLGSSAPDTTNLALFGDDGTSTPHPSPNVPLVPDSTSVVGTLPTQTLTANDADLNVEDMQPDNDPGGYLGDGDDGNFADPSQMEALHLSRDQLVANPEPTLAIGQPKELILARASSSQPNVVTPLKSLVLSVAGQLGSLSDLGSAATALEGRNSQSSQSARTHSASVGDKNMDPEEMSVEDFR